MKALSIFATAVNNYFLLFLFLFLVPSTAYLQKNDTIKPTDSLVIDHALDSLQADSIIQSNRVLKDTLIIAGVGDIMLGTNFPNAGYLPPKGKRLLAPVASLLIEPDCTFGNLEGTVLNSGGDVKECEDSTLCYAFRMPERIAWDLKPHGFDLISIANNHVGDFGTPGRESTVRFLDSMGVAYAGLESCPWDTITRDGIKYGFAAFSPNTGTIKINDYEQAKQIVQLLDSISDIVVVSFHGGAEGAKMNHVTRETEMFYGENRGNVFEFSRMVVDHGADVVFGHGPHVTRAIEVYKDRFIAYSLGNFATYARFNLRGVNGIAPLVHVYTHRDGKFIKGKLHSIKQVGRGGPILDPDKRVVAEIQRLNKEDFPENDLIIEDNGDFYLPVKDVIIEELENFDLPVKDSIIQENLQLPEKELEQLE